MGNYKTLVVNKADTHKAFLAVVTAIVRLFDGRSFKNEGCQAKIDLVLVYVSQAFVFVPLVFHLALRRAGL